MNKKRSIWKNLGWALATTPAVSFVGVIIVTLAGALDATVTKIQSAGYWWLILIVAYILSLIYFICEPAIRRDFERKKAVNGLILYWKEQLEKQGKSQQPDKEINSGRERFVEGVKIWAWLDPDLWVKYFPDEKYSKYLFGIVDNFIAYWQQQKSKYEKK